MGSNPLLALAACGQSVWLDFIRRGMIASGELAQMIEADGVRGVTSNPAIFEKAIAGSHDYDDAIAAMVKSGKNTLDIYETLAIDDVRAATDLFRAVYDRTDGRDGFVSLEVSPHLAHDAPATVAEARRLWAAVDRPNLMIKVPATIAGLEAIERLIADGVNVNVTLLFSLARYRQAAGAYLAGLQRRLDQGKPIDRIASVASFFLSRIDTAVDPQLERMARQPRRETARLLLGKTAVACAKIAYQIYGEIFGEASFSRLAVAGARTQRLLWASTSTKNPAYADLMYVEPLIGPATVNTLPLETLNAYRDHGDPADRLEQGVAEAEETLVALSELGVKLAEVTEQLEIEGIQKFIDPFDRLLAAIESRRPAT